LRIVAAQLDLRPQRTILLEASAERSAAMRLRIDRDHLDGNLIALVVITLLIAIALVY
jgi:hypothetical protein